MDQETFNAIVRILQRGAGVMAEDYIQAFTAVVRELQDRILAERKAAETPAPKPNSTKKKEG